MKKKKKTNPIHFLGAFSLIVVTLAVVKCTKPELSVPQLLTFEEPAPAVSTPTDSISLHSRDVDSLFLRPRTPLRLLKADGTPVKNRVTSVHRFETSFPDLNDVQLTTAQRIGVPQIADRNEANRRKDELVFIGDNPFYSVQKLSHSIPYLIPRAAILLEEIGRAFNDSLVTKGFAPHKLLVTSVLRTQEDVKKLRNVNRNASENSCHQYATTFDISYNRFLQINEDGSDEIRWVTAFKSILAEVLEDQRLAGTCYVKYEVHQSCFHITAR